jgi:hypothetical protein
MTFKEAVQKVIANNFEDGNFIEDRQTKALDDHTAFLDGIPDNDKPGIAQFLYDEIVEYNGERWKFWITTPPTAKPIRVINSELKTLNAFLELLDKHSVDNMSKEPPKKGENGEYRINLGPNPEYKTAQSIAQKMKHDLELLQKSCNQSDLSIIQKARYYKNTKTKEDITNTIKTIMKKNSIPIDYLSIQDIQEFIARL